MSDPHAANVSILMPLNGKPGDSTIPIIRNSQKTSAFLMRDAAFSSTQFKYYGSSLYLPGSVLGGAIIAGVDTQGPLTYTLELWIYFEQFYAAGSTIFYDQITWLHIKNDVISVGYDPVITSSPVTLNTWIHVACVVLSGTMSLFIDGVKVPGTSTQSDSGLPMASLGADPLYGDYIQGYIQDFRITTGVARYAENFVPPGPLVEPSTISGIVTNQFNEPVQRTVVAFRRSDPGNVIITQSDSVTGEYVVPLYGTDEVSRIVLSNNDPFYNDVVDRVIPEIIV